MRQRPPLGSRRRESTRPANLVDAAQRLSRSNQPLRTTTPHQRLSCGRSDFYSLLFRRDHPYFYAFDVLSLDGEDVCALLLIERKRRQRRIMPKVDTRLLYLDSIAERGRGSVSGCGPWVRLKIDAG